MREFIEHKRTQSTIRFFEIVIPYLTCVGVAYAIFMLQGIYHYSRENAAVQRSLAIQERVFGEVREAESGQRGYLITGDTRYLAQYTGALEDLRRDRRPMMSYLQHRPELAHYAKDLTAVIDQKTREMADVVATYQREGLDSASALVKTNQGYNLTEKMRDIVYDLRSQQLEHLRDLSQAF